MIIINNTTNLNAERLMKTFSRFRRIHWKSRHMQGLKPSEFVVLHAVKNAYMNGTDELMVSDISDRLNIARPTVTQLVNNLAKKGFLEKSRDERDRRIVRVTLSTEGRGLAKKNYDEFYRKFFGLTEHLGEYKSNELANLLQEAIEYFEKEMEHRKDKT